MPDILQIMTAFALQIFLSLFYRITMKALVFLTALIIRESFSVPKNPRPEHLVEPNKLVKPEHLVELDKLVKPEHVVEPDKLVKPEHVVEPEKFVEPVFHDKLMSVHYDIEKRGDYNFGGR